MVYVGRFIRSIRVTRDFKEIIFSVSIIYFNVFVFCVYYITFYIRFSTEEGILKDFTS